MKHLRYLFLCLLCAACAQKETTFLATAWGMVEKDPHQVICMLDTCSFSRPSSRAQKAWLLSRAYDKCDVNIADDSLIMQAVKYYKRTRNEMMYLRSLYCLGRVQLNAGDSDNALMTFEQTADLARKRKEWFWFGLSMRNLADIYHKAYCLEKGAQCEEEAVYAFTQNGDSLYLSYEQLALARAYHSIGKEAARDSLLSLLLAQHYQDSLLTGEIHKTQARALIERSYPLYEEAYHHYLLCPREVLDTQDWSNLLVILSGMGKTHEDYTASLLSQMNNIAQESNERSGILAHFALYRYHKRTGDYKKALSSYEKVMAYQDSLTRQKIQQSLVFKQKEYYKQQSLQEKGKRKSLLLSLITGTLLATLVVILLIQRNKEQRQQTETAMLQLEESQGKYERLRQESFQKQIDTLSRLAKEYYEDDGRAKAQQNILFLDFKRKLNAFREFSSELSFLEDDVNLYKNQAMAHFRKEFPGLSKHAYKMAIVFFAGLPNSLIGLLMNKATSTIRTERSLLRKKIADSTAPHKEDYLRLLDNYPRENKARSC